MNNVTESKTSMHMDDWEDNKKGGRFEKLKCFKENKSGSQNQIVKVAKIGRENVKLKKSGFPLGPQRSSA